MPMSEAFSVPFYTLLELCYTHTHKRKYFKKERGWQMLNKGKEMDENLTLCHLILIFLNICHLIPLN